MVRIGLNKTNFFFFFMLLRAVVFLYVCWCCFVFLFVFCLLGCKFFYTVDGCFFLIYYLFEVTYNIALIPLAVSPSS